MSRFYPIRIKKLEKQVNLLLPELEYNQILHV